MIEDIEYDNFVNAMTRLSSLPYAYRVKEFIYTYRKPLIADTKGNEIPKPQYDEQGRQIVTTYGRIILFLCSSSESKLNDKLKLIFRFSQLECLRKRARADVTIISPGTGLVTINGHDINYFSSTQCREQVSEILLL